MRSFKNLSARTTAPDENLNIQMVHIKTQAFTAAEE
jgi:hypothetical protein